MSNQSQIQKVNPVKALEQQISAARNVKDLLAIDAIKDRHMNNYMAVTGAEVKAAISKYERDVFSFMEKVNSNPELMQCDPMSIFAAFVKVGSYGISAEKIYLRPQGVKQKDGSWKQMMKVDPDPFGKKEMLERMSTIKRVNDPVLVFNKDVFMYSPKTKQVTKHEMSFPVPKPGEDTVMAVYVTVDWADGRSQDYMLSLEELKTRRAKSQMKEGGPLWQTHYAEAAKKSVINYLFKVEYKQPDAVVLYKQYEAPDEEEQKTIDLPDQQVDQTVIAQPESTEEPFNPAVNEQTGEEYQQEPVITGGKKNKKADQEPFV
jgi:recombinational DNA repair protein RecT